MTETTDWASIVIAVTALALSVITLYWQRKHNRLSLVPIPNIVISDRDNVLSIDLENNGIGPLIIKSINFSTDCEKTWKQWPTEDTFFSSLKTICPITTVLRKNSVIVSQQRERIFECNYNLSEPDQKEEIISVIGFFKNPNVMKIDYTDVYNKNKEPAWWKLWPVYEVYKVKISEFHILDDLNAHICSSPK